MSAPAVTGAVPPPAAPATAPPTDQATPAADETTLAVTPGGIR
ncbi:hypothetical protein [Streptomyces sp. YGL11-2]